MDYYVQEVNEAGSVVVDYVISPFKGSSRVDVIVAIKIMGHNVGLDGAHMPTEAKAREWRLVNIAQHVSTRGLSPQCYEREFYIIFPAVLRIPSRSILRAL